ncbi:hypothetical protein OEK97_28785, partial [Escherichia coli]|uniref:hypothetical protein n=1 Tax=Escherichia coli TaxID=562 RepID=UPI0021D7EB8F
MRTETNINDWLSIDLALNKSNAIKNNVEFVGGLRVTLPLDLDALFKLCNPLRENPKLPPLQERLLDRVIR